MIGTAHFLTRSIVAPSDAVMHVYATGEDLTLESPKLLVGGNPTDAYRAKFGYYCTSDSSLWSLLAEELHQLLMIEFGGESVQLAEQIDFFGVQESGFAHQDLELKRRQQLLTRIRSRRAKIEARVGILDESYLLIREDREK